MIFGWLLLFLPLAAVYFGRKALVQIERVPEEYTGKWLAKTGIGLGAGLGILLGGWLILDSGVPHGYEPLNWSDLEPDKEKNGKPSDAAMKLSSNKVRVYVRGYILPGRRQVQLSEFYICRTSDQCKYNMPITKTSDLIRIKFAGDRTVDFTTHEIGIGGVFHVDPDSPGSTPYYIDADYLN